MKSYSIFLFTIFALGLLGLPMTQHFTAHQKPPSDFYPDASNIRFAVIGDYGHSGQAESDVANQVKSRQPDFIVTTGDNNYYHGSWLTINQNIGQYYHDFIGSYHGFYGSGSTENRFFPALGNHDWMRIFCFQDHCQGAYLAYFSLPGNERYYDFVQGPVHFFVLDSNLKEPDGTTPDSVQGQWLKKQLQASTSAWNVVIAHHPPYSSGTHGSSEYMRWPFKEWGADVVTSGHDHTYERLFVNGLPYLVNGAGGETLYDFQKPLPESLVRYNDDYGALFVEANVETMTFKFITRTGEVVDEFALYSQQAALP